MSYENLKQKISICNMQTTAPLLAAALSILFSTTVHAELLFRDTFLTGSATAATLDPTTTPAGFVQYTGQGQTGSLVQGGKIAYTTVGIPEYVAIYDGAAAGRVYLTAINGGESKISLNQNFVSFLGLKIDFTADQPTGGSGTLRFGTAQGAGLGGANSGGGAIALFANGVVGFYDGPGEVARFTAPLLNPLNNALSLQLSTVSGQTLADLSLNGNVLDLNGAAAGTSYTYTTGFTQNFLTFSHYSPTGTTDTKINDFAVTAVPEPSTWFGASLIMGLVGWSQRRRFAKLSSRI